MVAPYNTPLLNIARPTRSTIHSPLYRAMLSSSTDTYPAKCILKNRIPAWYRISVVRSGCAIVGVALAGSRRTLRPGTIILHISPENGVGLGSCSSTPHCSLVLGIKLYRVEAYA
eukprot:3940745-Rhodomonas_salina.13